MGERSRRMGIKVAAIVVTGIFWVMMLALWCLTKNASKEIKTYWDKYIQSSFKAFIYLVIFALAIWEFNYTNDAQYFLTGFVIVASGIELLCNIKAVYECIKDRKDVLGN